MEPSREYRELYNDIANYRVLTKEQIKKLDNLTPLEKLDLIKLYNEVMQSITEAGLFEKI